MIRWLRRLVVPGLILLASCDKKSDPPGETDQYRAWKGSLFASNVVGGITGGVGTVPCTVDFQGFPAAAKDDQWVELAVNGQIVGRYSLYSATGAAPAPHWEGQVRQGMIHVKVFYTVANQGNGFTGETPHGTEFTITPGGSFGTVITQIETPK